MERMDKHSDQETQKKLHSAVAKAKEARMEMDRKQDAKRWANIGVPLRLEDALGRLTKEELSEVRKNLGIKYASALNKQELITELVRAVPESVQHLWPLFDQERYSLLKTIVSYGGVLPSPELENDRLDYLKNRGIVFTGTVDGTRMLVMPQEILEALRRIDDHAMAPIVRRNTEWIKLTHGMLHYYGTLKLSELETMLEKYLDGKLKAADYLHVIDDAISYYKEMRVDEHGFSNIRVWDSRQVKKEHGMRPGVDYYPFTKKQLLIAGEPGFVDRNQVYREFVDFFLNSFEMNRKGADLIAQECAYAARMGEHFMSIVQFLQSQFEFDSMEMLQTTVSRLTQLMNQTRQWFLKGHTPDELFEEEKKFLRPLPTHKADIIDMSTRKKVGRNDPCPCGSGKKFKKCCGG